MGFTVFRSSHSGAPSLTGQTGKLVEVLDCCLIINQCYTAVSGAAFVDNTTEARLAGGTAFALFQGPTASNDEAYFGMSQPFARLDLKFGTAGVQNAAITLAWEYWNGSAWTSLSVTDGTSELTADGTVSWTIPGSWATTSVNSVTLYWLRVRFTAGSWTTNPLVALASAGGWAKEYSGTSKAAYRSLYGNRLYLRVQDDGPGAGTFKEARITGYETMSDVDTGTGPFPTAAQGVGGVAMLVARKSTTADGTARSWILVADARTVYFFSATGDSAGVYMGWCFGEFYSLVNSDAYRTIINGRASENSGADFDYLDRLVSTLGAAGILHFVPRGHTGTGGSVSVGRHGDAVKSQSVTRLFGAVPYTNPADGGLYLSPIWITDPTTVPVNGLRGRMRGFWHFLHPIASVTDGDTVTGTGDLAGKTFLFIKQGQGASVYCIETSDTLETN